MVIAGENRANAREGEGRRVWIVRHGLPDDAAVRRDKLGKQAVVQCCQRRHRAWRAQLKHRLGTVVALLKRVAGNGKTAALPRQPGQCQRVDARPGGADLAPSFPRLPSACSDSVTSRSRKAMCRRSVLRSG